jgi:nucleoside-diphosphate-sugar epimerase
VNLPVALARLVAVAAEGCAALRRRAAVINRDRLRELTQARWVCDPSRAIEIGFRPLYPAARGVSETAAWYREARWL